MAKQLWILAGGNGAGKSTFYKVYLQNEGIFFVNADDISRKYYPEKTLDSSQKAQEHARRICHDYLEQGIPFCFETVFSHESKIELIKKAKDLFFEVILVYIHLSDPYLNVARVYQRVQDGGHAVPEDKILNRIPRAMKHIQIALKIVDEARLLDNSDSKSPFKQIANIKKGKIVNKVGQLPNWAQQILKLF